MYLKHIPMDGPQNFRDLGGFLTASGQVVAWNRLYRADGLSGLSEGDIAWFRRLNIRTIMDLRSTAEQAARPDRVPEGVRFCSCPMMREQGSGEQPGSASAFLQSLKVGYLAMIRDGAPLVGSAVNAVLDGLEQGAVVFHCTAGKDRTGVLAAVLLLLLGVSEEDITADYEVSYTYNARGVNRAVAQVPQLKPYLEQAGEDSVLHSNPKNIRAVLDELNAGTISGLLKAAGVSPERQSRLRRILLEPADD